MINFFIRRNRGINVFTFVCLVLVVAFATTSCENLRRKFKRKAKKTDEESAELPVLEPMEYPKVVHTPLDTYKYNYSLWGAWYKDLTSTILENGNGKRVQYLFNQILKNWTEMQNLLPEDKQPMLKECIRGLQNIQADILSPLPRSGPSSWVIDLQSLEKKVRKNYSVDQVESFLSDANEAP